MAAASLISRLLSLRWEMGSGAPRPGLLAVGPSRLLLHPGRENSLEHTELLFLLSF